MFAIKYVALSAIGLTLSSPFTFTQGVSGSRSPGQAHTADALRNFKLSAATTRTTIDRYAAAVRSGDLESRSHAREMNRIRDEVNQMGVQLAALELSGEARSGLQQAAIREARPQLEALANKLERAINLLNNDRNNYGSPEFREVVKQMYRQATRLYIKVDVIMDYEKAQQRAIAEDEVPPLK